MNPDFSPNNAANIRFVAPPNTGQPRPVGAYSSNNPQLRPRMEQLHAAPKSDIYSSQQNFQQYQSTPFQQQQSQRLPPNLIQQQPQHNPRLQFNEDLAKLQTMPNYNNSHLQLRGPNVSLDGQRPQMAPSIRFPNPQQPVRYPFNNSRDEIPNQSNSPNQQLKMEPPKAPMDQSNTPSGTTFSSKLPNPEINSPSILNSGQVTRETANTFSINNKPASAPSPGSIENRPDLVDDKTSLLRKEESKTNVHTNLNENENSDSESGEEIVVAKTVTKKKNFKGNSNILKDDGITCGTVQKNIKFFEQNDTAKKPLRPKTTTSEIKEKVTKLPSDKTEGDSAKNEFESGVDETPVVHPNLGSIFQIPRKVAKISFLKENKRSKKFKSKRYVEQTSKKKTIYEKPIFSQFLKPSASYSYRYGTKKNQNINTYKPEEELLSFFENTKSWRKLTYYGSKSNENTGKDKVVHKPTTNGDIPTPKKTPSKLQPLSKKNPPVSPVKTPLKSPGTPGTPGAKLLPKTPESPAPPTPLIKKVPMNKIQVGAAPSPNLKTIRSKVGSLANTTHKPGGGNIKIESHKIDLSNVQPRTEAKNDQYKPSGGDKKIQQVKLQWSAKSKVGSLENATYKPGGGDKKIESVKLDFKEKAKPKVGSKDNVKHVPGGGNVKIENQKLEFKAQSKVGSLDNVKHKPGGGDIKIFDDKTYLRQVSGNSSEGRASGTQAGRSEREVRTRSAPGTPGRQTLIKMKKITSFENTEEAPIIKKVTEIVVTSKTPKTNGATDNSQTNVKLTYSKIASLKNGNEDNGVELSKMPAKQHAPVLKSSLSEKKQSDDSETGKQFKGPGKKFDFETTSENKNSETIKQKSESPNLLQGKSNKRDDSGSQRFSMEEMTTQEKIGEIWNERNVLEKTNSYNSQPQERQQTSLSNPSIGNHHLKFPNPEVKNENPTIHTEQNIYTNQNFQSEKFSQNPSFKQSQLQYSLRPTLHSSEEYRISGSQQSQYPQNPYK